MPRVGGATGGASVLSGVSMDVPISPEQTEAQHSRSAAFAHPDRMKESR